MASWQAETETGVVVQIGFGVDEQAAPTTLPELGERIDWTKIASGEDMFGWEAVDFVLSEDEFEFTEPDTDEIVVKAPLQEKKVAKMRFGVDTPDMVVFKSYEIGAKILAFATNVSNTGSIYTKTTTYTRRAMLVEIGGMGFHYFPSVEISAGAISGGVKQLSAQEVKVDIFGTATIPSGYQWHQLVSA